MALLYYDDTEKMKIRAEKYFKFNFFTSVLIKIFSKWSKMFVVVLEFYKEQFVDNAVKRRRRRDELIT